MIGRTLGAIRARVTDGRDGRELVTSVSYQVNRAFWMGAGEVSPTWGQQLPSWFWPPRLPRRPAGCQAARQKLTEIDTVAGGVLVDR